MQAANSLLIAMTFRLTEFFSPIIGKSFTYRTELPGILPPFLSTLHDFDDEIGIA